MKIVQLLLLVSNPDIFFNSQKKNDLDTKAQGNLLDRYTL